MRYCFLSIVLLFLCVPSVQADPCPFFLRAQRSFDTEEDPRGIAVADLNEDGSPDMVVATHRYRYVSVLLADSSVPDLFNGSKYRTWGGPVDVAIGDFNNDDIYDLAVVCESTGTVSVLIGNGTAGIGDGTFLTRVDYAAGAGAHGIAVDDLDGDGELDLAIACPAIDSVAVLIGAGDGTFASPDRYPAGPSPGDVVVAHVNGDTIPDLILTCSTNDSLSILDGVGGSFLNPRSYDAGDEPWRLAVSDFNGDDVIDIAIANRYGDALSILRGNGTGGVGDGTFQPPDNYPAGNGPSDLAVGDLDNDGVDDIALSNAYDDFVLVFHGDGDGSFGVPESLFAGYESNGIAIAPMNGDALPDLMVTSGVSNDVAVLLADPTGDGTLLAKRDIDVGRGPQGVTYGDWNEDGIVDLATGDARSNQVTILLGGGADSTWDGTFLSDSAFAVGNYPMSIASGDFNGDGITDLVTSNRYSGDISVLIGNGTAGAGDGTFSTAVSYAAGNQNRHVVPADLNGDGALDLLVAASVSHDVTIFFGNESGGTGDGTFQLFGTVSPGNGPQYIALEDYDGDGILDMAVANSGSDNLAILTGGGSGGVWDSTFQSPVLYPVGIFPTCVVAADLDGDDIFDLVVADLGSDRISVLMGNGSGGAGDGTFAGAVPYAAGDGCRRLSVADWNGDGQLDIAATNFYSHDISLFAGNGDGTFEDETRYDGGVGTWGIAAVPFDADGPPAIVVTNYDGWDISILLNCSCGITGVSGGVVPARVPDTYNTPNPFNPLTTIHYTLTESGLVSLDVYDIRGRSVVTLIRGHQRAGSHQAMWNGRNRSGALCPSGLYFYRIFSGSSSVAGKMLLIR